MPAARAAASLELVQNARKLCNDAYVKSKLEKGVSSERKDQRDSEYPWKA
jgi:hypothetical protein